ncbi:hypothetical protein GCM10010191_35350 [Actinomadura vinacea]|uniref:Uncharacterized protein n=1 Tax=Actinomadura vinacea TaxID=115336 RepID=A0ABN3J2R1_9ACTN
MTSPPSHGASVFPTLMVEVTMAPAKVRTSPKCANTRTLTAGLVARPNPPSKGTSAMTTTG